jgi:hypothetical protein
VPRNEPRWSSSTTRSVEKPSLDRERLHFGKRLVTSGVALRGAGHTYPQNSIMRVGQRSLANSVTKVWVFALEGRHEHSRVGLYQ